MNEFGPAHVLLIGLMTILLVSCVPIQAIQPVSDTVAPQNRYTPTFRVPSATDLPTGLPDFKATPAAGEKQAQPTANNIPTPTSWLPYATDLPPAKATQVVGEIQTQQAGFNLPTLDPQENFLGPIPTYDVLFPLDQKINGKIAGAGVITQLDTPFFQQGNPYSCQREGWRKDDPVGVGGYGPAWSETILPRPLS
jgi:hypothetical protein